MYNHTVVRNSPTHSINPKDPNTIQIKRKNKIGKLKVEWNLKKKTGLKVKEELTKKLLSPNTVNRNNTTNFFLSNYLPLYIGYHLNKKSERTETHTNPL